MRLHVVLTGKVQGVFFRSGIKEHADHYGVGGWVRNNRDGTLEAVFEGSKETLSKLLAYCKKGPAEALVSDVQAKWSEKEEGFGEFLVEH